MKKIILHSLLLIFYLGSKEVSAQGNLYAEDSIQIIEITFQQANWDYMMDTAKAGSDGYTIASQVKINGVTFAGAGVRYKGNSSYDSTRRKNPLHIKLDYTSNNANYDGYSDIKVSNEWSDPSMIREILAYHVLKNYMDEPLSNFAKVYINGIYYGVYTSSEDADSKFLDARLYSSDRSFFKANPLNVVNGHIPSLTYLGSDSTQYYDRYELESKYAWKELVNLCDTIANAPSSLDKLLDVDRALWMLAFNDVTVNLDSYSGLFAQNYYLYQDHNRRFNPLVWDLNMCFGGFTNTGSANLSVTQEQQMTPLLHSGDAARPLIKNLLADSTWYKMYVAHMRTISHEFFQNGNYLPVAQSYRLLIDTSVQSENYSLYSYSQFQNGMTTTTGTIPGVQQLMDVRSIYLDTTTEFLQVPPVISTVQSSPAIPSFASPVMVTAMVTNTNSGAVFLGYRYKKSDPFIRIQMYDDGTHNDGASGDHVFGVTIQVNSMEIQYYIYAENDNAGIFSPERAEHEFYLIHPSITLATTQNVAINEFVAGNSNGIVNENGKHKDWIELYNTTATSLGLRNLFLSDRFSNPLKWRFSSADFLPANGYLLVWADGENKDLIEEHTNFSLNNSGDSILLSDSTLSIADSVIFGTQTNDIAMARCPDGTGSLVFATPTPRVSDCSSGTTELNSSDNRMIIFPDPASDLFSFSMDKQEWPDKVSIMNTIGQIVMAIDSPASNTINISDLNSGIYIVCLTNHTGKKRVVKLVKN